MFWLMILSTGKIWLGKYVLTCVCFGMGYPRSARHIEPTGVFRYWYKSKYDVWQFTYEIYIARYDIHSCSIKRHYILICIYAISLCWANTEIPTAWSPKWRRKQTSRGRDVTRTRSIHFIFDLYFFLWIVEDICSTGIVRNVSMIFHNDIILYGILINRCCLTHPERWKSHSHCASENRGSISREQRKC